MDPEPTPSGMATERAREPSDVRAAIVDRRPLARGALPRQAQIWIMLGLACVILVVILITGRPASGPEVSIPTAVTQSGTVPPERVRSYQERLAEQEARLQAAPGPIEPLMTPAPAVAAPVAVDPLVMDRRRREQESLFADNVAFSRRAGPQPTAPPTVLAGTSSPSLSPAPGLPQSPSSVPAAAGPSSIEAAVTTPVREAGMPSFRAVPATVTNRDPQVAESGPIYILLEGTVIETVLVNRLDGTFQGPVDCLVTTPVYSHDRQVIVIPAGARVLGSAAPVQTWGETRLAVRFHRLVMPDGRTYTLDSFTGLNQVGETGLRDQVDRHYLQVFDASLAIGAISGLAQAGTRGGWDLTANDAARQAAGASLANSTARVLDRYLNVLPTVTIREGHRIKVVLTNDLRLPAAPGTTTTAWPAPAARAPLTRPLASGGFQ